MSSLAMGAVMASPRAVVDQGAGVRVRGPGQHGVACALLDDPATAQHDQPVARPLGERQVVGDV